MAPLMFVGGAAGDGGLHRNATNGDVLTVLSAAGHCDSVV